MRTTTPAPPAFQPEPRRPGMTREELAAVRCRKCHCQDLPIYKSVPKPAVFARDGTVKCAAYVIQWRVCRHCGTGTVTRAAL